MAKRRAEHTLQHDFPPKRYCRSLLGVGADTQLESMAPAAGNVPAILALLGGRSRKRPHCFDDTEMLEKEADPHLKTAVCLSKRNAANILMEPISGGFQDRRRSCPFTNKKRPREDCVASDDVIPTLSDKTEADEHTEDCTYNSFQYWRVPLSALDLSLLQDTSDHSQLKVCDSLSNVMET